MVNKTWVVLLTCFVGLFGALFTGLGTNTLDKVFNRDGGKQQEAPSSLVPDPTGTPDSDSAFAQTPLERADINEGSTSAESELPEAVSEEPEEPVTPDFGVSASDARLLLKKPNNKGTRFGVLTLNLTYTNHSDEALRFVVNSYSTSHRMKLVLSDGSVLLNTDPAWPTCRERIFAACVENSGEFQKILPGESLDYVADFEGPVPDSVLKTANDLTPAKLYAQVLLLKSGDESFILPVQIDSIDVN